MSYKTILVHLDGSRRRTERPDLALRLADGDRQHLEQLIDESLEETFPASDPPRPALPAMAEHSSYAPRVRAELVPMSEAAERYVQLMSPLPAIPTEATLRAAAERLARLVPLLDLNGNPVDKSALVHLDRVMTTRAALDAALAIMRR